MFRGAGVWERVEHHDAGAASIVVRVITAAVGEASECAATVV